MGGQPGVALLDQLGRVGVHRPQAFEQRLGHVERAVRPDPIGLGEVALHIRVGQLGRGAGETAGHGLKLHVGQLLVADGLVPCPFLGLGRGTAGAGAHRELAVGGGVALGELRVDAGLVDLVDGGERLDERPAHVVVDVQSIQRHGAVEQAAHVRGEFGVALFAVAQVGVGELELVVGTGFGGVRQRPQFGGHTAQHVLAAGRRHVVVRGGAHAAQRVAERGGLGLVRKQLERGLDEPLGRQFGVAGHIPQRQPDHGTGERVVETVQVLDRELQRGGVEAQLGVGQVVVVDQDERQARLAGGLGYHGGLAVHVEFDAVGAHDAAGGRVLVVEADGQAVRAQHRMLGRRALGQGQGGDGAVRVLLDVRGDGVDAGLFEPQGAPRLHVAAGGGLQLVEQVVERGVGERMAGQVAVDAVEEALAAHIRDELLEHGGALGVGDAVEVHVRIVQVVDRGDDRVRGRQLVLVESPALLAGAERGPGVGPIGGLGGGERGGELGEGFVQPQVVPPLHRHIVAEPHVGQLVQHGHHAAFGERVGHLGVEHVLVADRDQADVLHRARVVLRHVDLVVLGVRVRDAPGLGVEREALLGDVEQVVDVLGEGLGQRLAAVLAHRHDAAVLVLVLGVPLRVRASADSGQVGAHRHGRLEHPALDALGRVVAQRAVQGHAVHGFHGAHRLVRQHDPAFRSGHIEVEHGLQVGLVEHGVDAAGVRHLELGVQVHVAVGGVHAAVQALAGVGVLAHGLDDDLVVILEVVQLDAAVREHGDGIERLAVQHDLGHLVGDQVKEGGGTGLGVERDLGGGCEILGTDSQIKRNPVVDGRRDDGLALPGFDPGEICSWHCVPFWLAGVVAFAVRRTPDMEARGGLVNRRGQWLSYSLESSVAAMSATTGTIIGLRCSWRATHPPSVRRMICCSL